MKTKKHHVQLNLYVNKVNSDTYKKLLLYAKGEKRTIANSIFYILEKYFEGVK